MLRNVQLMLEIAGKPNEITTYVFYFLTGYKPLGLEK